MKKISLLLFLAFSGNYILAQSYNTAGGLRLGWELGITAKQRVLKNTTIEGIIHNAYRSDLTSVTVLGAQHYKVLTRRLNIFMGGGVHKGWITNDRILFNNPVGVTAIAGVEFTVRRWNISYDFKPAINLYGGQNRIDRHTSLSLRYVFVPRDSKIKRFFKEKKWKFWKKENNKKRNR